MTVFVTSSGVKAADIIRDALTFHLNRLSPGETVDPDTEATCLAALNNIADQWNGQTLFLFSQVITESNPITGGSAVLGIDWPTLAPGVEILGVTFGDQDQRVDPITMAQYQQTRDKQSVGSPAVYAYDGGETLYFVPGLTGQTVKLRTMVAVDDFADVGTVYMMPKGYRSALAVCLAEKLAPVMNPQVLPVVKREAQAARRRVQSRNIDPEILGAGTRGNIFTGWN